MRWILVGFYCFALLSAQTASWADGPAGERTVKAFHRSDFVDVAASTGEMTEQDLSQNQNPISAWAPLFDGNSESSVLMRFAGDAEHALIAVDNPTIDRDNCALVGRWEAAGLGMNGGSLFGGGGDHGGTISQISLKLTEDYDTSKSTVTDRLLERIGAFEAFRFAIVRPPPSDRIRRLTLSIMAPPNVNFVFEDVRLVASAGAAVPGVLVPAAGLPPAGMTPTAKDAVDRFDYDPWAVGLMGSIAPVCIGVSSQPGLRFCRRPADGSPRRVSLVSVDAPPVTAGDFGAIGEINYAGPEGKGDFEGSAYFELTASFPDGTQRVVGTTAAFGPCQMITGQSEDRPMALAMHSSMQPTRLRLELVSDGVGQVGFSNISLVQFEPAPVVAGAMAAVLPSMRTDQRMIRGAGWSAAVASVLLAIVVVLVPRFTLARNAGPIVMLGVGEVLFAWGMFLIGRGEAVAQLEPLFAGAIAWVLPVLARWVVVRRVHERELRRMLTMDAV
jgi:hypothetical protein